MKALNRYNGVSLILHAILILAMVDIGFSAKNDQAYEVFDVDIVAEAPSAIRQPAQKKAVNTRSLNSKNPPKAISGINKEKALPDITPELSASKIEPAQRDEVPYPDSSPSSHDAPAPQSSAPVSGMSQGNPNATRDENAYLMSLWKSQVMALVQRVWKAPPEIAYVEKSLKTTYQLRISRTGELLNKRLLVSSGNNPYDRSVNIALNSIKRLPQPPFFMMAGKESEDFTMSFTPPKGAE